MQLTAQYLDSHNDNSIPSVDFVFDEQGGLGNQAALWYRWEKERDPMLARFLGAPPIFHNDKFVVALQAADMVAWHIRREHQFGQEKRPVASMIMDYVVCKDIDAETLESAARKMRRVPGVRRIQTKASWRAAKKTIQALVDSGAPAPSTNRLRLRILNIIVNTRQSLNSFHRWHRRR
jgi:hypothetical protein